jgi:hypothetical protein
MDAFLTGEATWPPPFSALDSTATRLEEELDDWAMSAQFAVNIAVQRDKRTRFTGRASWQMKHAFPVVCYHAEPSTARCISGGESGMPNADRGRFRDGLSHASGMEG